MTSPNQIHSPTKSKTAQNPLFEIKDLAISYNKKIAVKKFSVNILSHRVTALIGPSGCGKSSFLRSLNRISDLIDNCQLEGQINYKGQNILAENYDTFQLRQQVAMTFQSPFPICFISRRELTLAS